ncbi:MAG: DUF4262 domain-containing protein [Actinomycetota bacterium]|nr:DUF4262 domain-containing protein [Actinomycetota bacterium]
MTAPPEHDSPTKPFWIVQSVFDPDDPWRDFAYTIGLAERGLPELHVHCRPSFGDDPAPDWRFSQRDMAIVLNDIAARVLRGVAEVGNSWSSEYDAGMSVVTFRIDPPGDRDELEAFGIAPGAEVLPVRWSLDRGVRGRRVALTSTERRRANASYDGLLDRVSGREAAPPGWALPAKPTFAVNQRYGPRTPLVLARAAQIWLADPEVLANFLKIALGVDRGGSVMWPAVCAAAEGRRLGLDDAVDLLRDDVIALVQRFDSAPLSRRWSETVDVWLGDDADAVPAAERQRLRRSMSGLLADATFAALAVEVLGEAATESTRMAGQGPWLSAQVSEGAAPGRAWDVAPAVVGAVRGLLSDCNAGALLTISRSHTHAELSDPDYGDVISRLLGWSVSSAASCPPFREVLPAAAEEDLMTLRL